MSHWRRSRQPDGRHRLRFVTEDDEVLDEIEEAAAIKHALEGGRSTSFGERPVRHDLAACRGEPGSRDPVPLHKLRLVQFNGHVGPPQLAAWSSTAAGPAARRAKPPPRRQPGYSAFHGTTNRGRLAGLATKASRRGVVLLNVDRTAHQHRDQSGECECDHEKRGERHHSDHDQFSLLVGREIPGVLGLISCRDCTRSQGQSVQNCSLSKTVPCQFQNRPDALASVFW